MSLNLGYKLSYTDKYFPGEFYSLSILSNLRIISFLCFKFYRIDQFSSSAIFSVTFMWISESHLLLLSWWINNKNDYCCLWIQVRNFEGQYSCALSHMHCLSLSLSLILALPLFSTSLINASKSSIDSETKEKRESSMLGVIWLAGTEEERI